MHQNSNTEEKRTKFWTDFASTNMSVDEQASFVAEYCKTKLKIEELKPMQSMMIHKLLENTNSIFVAPTGFGKSILYAAFTCFKRIILVVTPLVTIMTQQTQKYAALGINVTFLGSTQDDPQIREKLEQRKYNLIFFTPEFWAGAKWFQKLMERFKHDVELLVFDELDCAYTTKDYRIEYSKIYTISKAFLYSTKLGLTATLPPSKVHHLYSILSWWPEPQIIRVCYSVLQYINEIDTRCPCEGKILHLLLSIRNPARTNTIMTWLQLFRKKNAYHALYLSKLYQMLANCTARWRECIPI